MTSSHQGTHSLTKMLRYLLIALPFGALTFAQMPQGTRPPPPVRDCTKIDGPSPRNLTSTCPHEQTCIFRGSAQTNENGNKTVEGTCIGSSCGGLEPHPPLCPYGQTCLNFVNPELHLPGKCVFDGDLHGIGRCRAGIRGDGNCKKGSVCVVDAVSGCVETGAWQEAQGEYGGDKECWGLCMPEKWANCFEEGRWPGCH